MMGVFHQSAGGPTPAIPCCTKTCEYGPTAEDKQAANTSNDKGTLLEHHYFSPMHFRAGTVETCKSLHARMCSHVVAVGALSQTFSQPPIQPSTVYDYITSTVPSRDGI
eukprot:915885-Amphidinium_carterae.1